MRDKVIIEYQGRRGLECSVNVGDARGWKSIDVCLYVSLPPRGRCRGRGRRRLGHGGVQVIRERLSSVEGVELSLRGGRRRGNSACKGHNLITRPIQEGEGLIDRETLEFVFGKSIEGVGTVENSRGA